ncbi:hypothetical protein CEXT_164751 [Caerostris extrusa]|uniref:Uncharacterized protein n=1 Tax=Caerostris extrusa TaxID=172846 RepID=A0AAV4T8L6_CAEEX|nr:hypothetical protein CEXT_164751 [Caerostris extrusa]
MLPHGTLNALRYRDVLMNPVVHSMLDLPLFSKHISHPRTSHLLHLFLDKGTTVQLEKESPERCPDLNPIESTWNAHRRNVAGQ